MNQNSYKELPKSKCLQNRKSFMQNKKNCSQSEKSF
jgi:hypothetical protein